MAAALGPVATAAVLAGIHGFRAGRRL
jgi:hypothetical protein